jgi:hypothetical protein
MFRLAKTFTTLICLTGAGALFGCPTHVLHGSSYQVSGTLVEAGSLQPIANTPLVLQLRGTDPWAGSEEWSTATDAAGRFCGIIGGPMWCSGGGAFASYRKPPAPPEVSSVAVRLPDRGPLSFTVPVAASQQKPLKSGERAVDLGRVPVPESPDGDSDDA